MYKRQAYTPWDWQPKLKDIAEKLGLICFSSPFDKTAIDFLETMNVPAYKVASFEITDTPLISYMASKGKPMILATGVSFEEDIRDAIDACKRAGNNQIIILKCTSAYPTPYEEMNLLTIPDLKKRFNVIPGISDHVYLFFIGKRRIHGEAQAVCIKILCHRHVVVLPSQFPVVRHQMNRDIMDLCKNLVLPKEII